MLKINKYRFEPGARSIIQMGEELIGHPTTAINELVKNGYDADATTGRVYVHYNKDNEKSFLVISDNGLGMDGTVLFGDWLQPSVSKKRTGDGKSQVLRRNLLGSKGIGRLAAMALGRYLTVISKTAEEQEYNWLTIDREDFKQEALLSEISFPGGSTGNSLEIFNDSEVTKKKNNISNPELITYLENNNIISFTEGTVIIVELLDNSVRTIIEEEFLNADLFLENMSLVRSLRILITPLYLNAKIQDELISKKLIAEKVEISSPESIFELWFGSNLLKKDQNNSIFIKIEEFEILSNYDYRLLGRVDGSGAVIGIYTCNRLTEDSFEKKLFLEQDQVFSDESSRKRIIESIQKDKQLTSGVGEFLFDIRVYDRDPDSMDKLSKILKTNGRRETAYLLDSFVGLRISKNGFGVKPYGEEDKDWMGLSQMRVQDPSVVLGVNQIIGNVFLYSPQNDSLSEKTNREGFFENESFITFKKILRSILIEAGQSRYNYRQKHGIGRRASSKNDKPDPTRFLDLISKITSDEKVLNTAKHYVAEITTALDHLENSLTFSQRLATLGSGLELVYHEIAQPISLIGGSLFAMKFPIGKVTQQELKDELLEEIKQIKAAIETLNKLKESLEPAIGKAKKHDFKPIDTLNKVCYLFTKDLIENKISIHIDDNIKQYSIRDYEYYLWVSFLNILNNAFFWLKSDKENKEKKIFFAKGAGNEIIISNNGPEIDSTELENIFNYGVSHKKVKNATGLGLAYTRSLLSANDWEIWAENYPYGPAFILKKI
jgi:signal transduction histidine kinase